MDVHAGWFDGRGPSLELARGQTENLAKQIGDDFYKSLGSIASDFVPVVVRESKSRGVDPLYTLHLLFERHRRWKKLVGNNWLAMKLVLDVANDWSNNIPEWSKYRFPDDERQADEAIKAVAQWAGSEWTQKALKLFMAAIKKRQDVAEYIVKDKARRNVSGKEVMCWTINSVMETLDNKPRLWPRYHQTLWSFANRLFMQKGLSCPL